MPYIVETHRYLNDPTAEFLPDALPVIERRAVATLDVVKVAVGAKIREQWGYFGKSIKSPPDHLRDCHELSKDGGTIGPLPDGTVIEVRRVRVLERDRYALDQEWCDAYNARCDRVVA